MGYKKMLAALGIVILMGTGSAYAEKREVKVLNWSEMSKIVPRDDYAKDLNNAFTVYDIQTNKSFRLIRTGGTNHADVEPVTKEDCAKYEEVFGGWTWTPRPVVIEIGGVLYGASLDAMPHAGYDDKGARIPIASTPGGKGRPDYKNTTNYDSVKGNGMDGHTNLHFKSSVTHSGEKTKHPATITQMEGLVKDGYDTSGATPPPSGDSANGDSSASADDGNPEANVKDIVDTKQDGFVTGRLIKGTKKLATWEPEKKINIVDGNAPSGSYYFSYDGVMVGPCKGGGVGADGLDSSVSTADVPVSGNLFNKVLQGKERAVAKEVQDLQKDSFKTSEVSGDLNGTQDFWNYDLNQLYKNTSASNFTISDGGKSYTIYVPKGVDANGKQINGRIIGATIRSIEMYKKAVLEGMYGGMVVASYNLFSMYPTVQLPMTDVIDITKIDKNNVRPLKSSGRMKYTLDYYFHPVLGKISAEELPQSDGDWYKKFEEIKYTAQGGKLSFTLDENYREFMDGTDPLRQGTLQMKNAILKKSNGMRGINLALTNDKAEPASMVGTLFRVIVPKQFEKRLTDEKYILNENTGYTVLNDVRLMITHAMVYVGKEDDLKVGGDYAQFGIDEKGLAFYKTVVDGKTVGAVVPLWYNEAVYDPYEDKLYYTGRPIRFDNDYIGKIKFTQPNVELFTAVEKAGGNRRVTIQEFAFGEGKNYLSYEDHQNIGNAPEVFDLNITFEGHVAGKPDENHSTNGGAVQGENSEGEGEGDSDSAEGESNTDANNGADGPTNGNNGETVAFYNNYGVVTPNYGMPTLLSVAYANEDNGVLAPSGYEPYATPPEDDVNWLSRINPFSRANTGASASDANKDWGHGVKASDLAKISKGMYKGKEDLIIKVSNVYKVNPALMLSIMIVENGGNSSLLNRAYNCGSLAWWKGCGYPKDDTNPRWIKFPNIDEGINYMGAYLSRGYMAQGKTTLESMGKKYCPPTYKDWAKKVGNEFKKATGKTWSSSDAGSGIKDIMQIDIKEITNSSGGSSNTDSSSNSNGSTNGNDGVELLNTDEVFNGFTIVRNNVYVQEPGLLQWLRSKEARALTNVEAEELEEKIMGESDMSNQMLSYEDWARMQDIKEEMGEKHSLDNKLLLWTRIITMVFGLLLIFYSILLIFAYYIDIFNALLDISLLSMMTFGRFYPVANKEDIQYMDGPTDGQRYVTIFNLLVIVGIGIFVGGVFILSTPILRVIATMYLKIKRVLGGF